MKFKGSLFFSICSVLALLVIASAFYPKVDSKEKEAILIQSILTGLNQFHYNPVSLDNDFSKKVFDLYLDRIDRQRRFLTQKDIVELKAYELKIDDESNEGTYEFFNISEKLLKAGRAKAQDYYKEILAKPFDFTIKESIEMDHEKKPFAISENDLKDNWRKLLKYDVMNKLNNKINAQKDKEKDGTMEEGEKPKTIEEMEAEARKDALKNYDDWFERMSKERRADYMNDYLNTITNIFDPHTGYFMPKDKENFDITMSGTLEGIGARLQTDNEYTKVISIVPGGPAWKQKGLEEGDLITSVAQEGEEPVDVTGFRIDDVVKLIRGKKGTEVVLTVKKKVDSKIKAIPIIRDVVLLDESYAKSAILNYPGKAENIGYLKLPRFYADFNRKGGRSCATDVALEIEKLNKANVNGIILDLRNNGGGSLRDVVRMSGLFIEEGPIVQVKGRGYPAEILEDEDPKVQYDGPLIIMVNNYSASASEIIAAAMQDYGRAVIVGSNSTFGKGTVQRFFDLDRAVRGNPEVKPLGEVKLTIQKFYRVDGGSTQLKGVVPDIILPDNFHYMKTGEKEQEYPMKWTKIDPVSYTQNVTKLENISTLKAASEKRLKSNPIFQKIDENARRFKRLKDQTNYTLNMDEFQKEEEKLDKESEMYEDMFTVIDGLSIKNLPVDLPEINSDSSKIARNDSWIEGLSKDVYLEETLSIMKDMIAN